MKRLIALLLAFVFCSTALAAGKKRFTLFAMFVADTHVHLAEGAQWVMFKGDTFPVVMFKEQQTQVVLQLAGTTFITPAASVKLIEEKDLTPEQLATYRTNVEHYLDSQAEKWKEQAHGQQANADPGKATPAK